MTTMNKKLSTIEAEALVHLHNDMALLRQLDNYGFEDTPILEEALNIAQREGRRLGVRIRIIEDKIKQLRMRRKNIGK